MLYGIIVVGKQGQHTCKVFLRLSRKLLAFQNFTRNGQYSMINNTGQRLHIVTENDGEIIFTINKDEKFTVRSALQTQRDKYYSPKVQVKGVFIKVMKSEKKLIELLKGSSSTYAAVNIMKHYLVSNYNVLIKDGRKYKATDLAEDMGITRQMATIHINKLKALNVLGMIETDKGKLYCLNPQYYFKGTEVPQSVLDIFDNTKKK